MTSAEGVPTPWTDHNDGPITWREVGSGQPVLFLHGLGGSRSAWGEQLRELSATFRCIAWDMPGYGGSAPITPLTYEQIADALVGFLDRLGIDQAHLVGLSFGGMHALHTVLRHPGRVGRIVLADTSPAFGMDGTVADEWVAARLAPLDTGRSVGDAAEAIIDAITAAPLTGQIRDETIGAVRRIPNDGFRAAVRCLPTNDVRHRLPEISHPCAVLVGELDRETPVSYAQALADGLPNANFHVLEGCGHLSPAEAPDEFNAIVRAFLTT